MGLIVFEAKEAGGDRVARAARQALFRATDGVYGLGSSRVALVLDDCKPEDLPRVLERFYGLVGGKAQARSGVAHCPSDTSDPRALLELALSRIG